jgi:hypothetical protein
VSLSTNLPRRSDDWPGVSDNWSSVFSNCPSDGARSGSRPPSRKRRAGERLSLPLPYISAKGPISFHGRGRFSGGPASPASGAGTRGASVWSTLQASADVV